VPEEGTIEVRRLLELADFAENDAIERLRDINADRKTTRPCV
jgi:hypothetical protein